MVSDARVAPVALYVTIVAVAAGSSSVAEVARVAVHVRWVTLYVLAGAALVLVHARLLEHQVVPGLWFVPLPVAFVLLAAVSAAWSLDPSLTLRRTASLAILMLTAGALGSAAALDRRDAGRLLVAVVAAATTIALLGLVVLAWSPTLAVQGLDGPSVLRFRGFGGNPNTAAMLYAVALAPAGWLALSARSGLTRAAAGVSVLLFAGSLIASLSRGAMLAGLFGASLVALTLVSGWSRRSAAMTAILVVFIGVNTVRSFDPGPTYPEGTSARTGTGTETGPDGIGTGTGTGSPGVGDGNQPVSPGSSDLLPRIGVRPEDEIGHPAFGVQSSTAGSGRVAAWKGALTDVRERPLLGTGFGTESLAFTDRWYFFQGANPENAYLGLLLQLGGVGLALFLVLGLALVVSGTAALRHAKGGERGLIAATLGAVLAGAVLMVSQSYVYSVGNIATVTFWVCACMLAALVDPPSLPRAGRRSRV